MASEIKFQETPEPATLKYAQLAISGRLRFRPTIVRMDQGVTRARLSDNPPELRCTCERRPADR